jgi:hypothetical protein
MFLAGTLCFLVGAAATYVLMACFWTLFWS